MLIQRHTFTIRPVQHDEISAVLEVYEQCGDFLALTPNPVASLEMVRADRELSQQNGGLYCGIHTKDGLVGVLDVISSGFEGDPSAAFIELLMIAAPYRSSGLGQDVVQALEAELRRNPSIRVIWTAVMVNNPAAIRFWERQGYGKVGAPQLQPDGTTTWKLCKD